MARQTKDWKPGDKSIESRDINALFALLRQRLGMDGPFNLSSGAGGEGISFDEGLLSNICVAKTDAAYGLTYPTADSTPGAELWAFPIKLYPHAWFDCADSSPIVQEHIESGLGDVVYNVAHKHIPEDKFLIVVKINGVWWTYWTPATADDTITLGIYLDEDIAASAGPIDATIDGTATPIEVWDSQHLFPDAINGTKGRVVWELATSKWELVEVKRDAGGSTTLPEVRFRNLQPEDAPLHGILEVIDYDEADVVWNIKKPTWTDTGASTVPGQNYLNKLYLINTGGVVAQNAIGTGKFPQDTYDNAIEVLYDTTDPPEVGNCIGPFPGSWKGRLNIKGWHVLSINGDDETCRIFQNQLRSARGTTVQAWSDVGTSGAIAGFAVAGSALDTRPILAKIDFGGVPGLGIAGHGRLQMISGPRGSSTAATSHCEAYVPIEEPIRAVVSSDLADYFYSVPFATIAFQFTLGIIPDTNVLGPGLPGYICLSYFIDEDDDGNKWAYVMRDFTTTSWWGKVYSWNASTGALEIKPCLNQAGDFTYNGTGGMPDLGPYKVQIDCDLKFRCPNIAVGDAIRYAFGPMQKIDGTDQGLYYDTLYLVSNCYDDPIGTVKAWVGGTIPRGWRRYTSWDDKIITSYSAVGSDRIPIKPAATGTAIGSYSMIWIERYQ